MENVTEDKNVINRATICKVTRKKHLQSILPCCQDLKSEAVTAVFDLNVIRLSNTSMMTIIAMANTTATTSSGTFTVMCFSTGSAPHKKNWLFGIFYARISLPIIFLRCHVYHI